MQIDDLAEKIYAASGHRFNINSPKQLGDVLKSGDLIGWRPVVITPDMVGKCLAQFVSVECKGTDSRTDRGRLEAQQHWADLVNREGGYAVFVSEPEKL